MKHGALNHRKLKRLMKGLGVSKLLVVGILESLWQLTASQARQGDIGRLSNEDIADEIDWEGDPSKLIATLCDARWLDRSDQHRLLVHDWHEHAPNWVKGLLKANGLEFLTNHLSTSSPIPIPIPIPAKTPSTPPPKTGSKGSTQTPSKTARPRPAIAAQADRQLEPFDGLPDPNPPPPTELEVAMAEFLGKSPANIPAKFREKAAEFAHEQDGYGLEAVLQTLAYMKRTGLRWRELGPTIIAIKRIDEKAQEKQRARPPTRESGGGSPMSPEAKADQAKARAELADLVRRYKAIPEAKLAKYVAALRKESPMLESLKHLDISKIRGFEDKWLPAIVKMHEDGSHSGQG